MTVKRRRFQQAAMLAAAASALAIGSQAEEGNARDLVKRVLDAVPKVPFTAKVTLTSDRGWVRQLALSRQHLDGVDASYMEVTAPLDLKDTRFLLFDRPEGLDEQFIYVPAVKRIMQVSGETRKQPFLGSDFYVSDMVRPELDAFTYGFVGEEDVGGRHCNLVEGVPKHPEQELYAKTVSAIDPADLLVLRVQFFDQKGKLLKVWTLEKVEKIDGIWTPLAQQMAHVQDKHWSRLELTEIQYGAKLPAEIFNRTYLKR